MEIELVKKLQSKKASDEDAYYRLFYLTPSLTTEILDEDCMGA